MARSLKKSINFLVIGMTYETNNLNDVENSLIIGIGFPASGIAETDKKVLKGIIGTV